MLTPGDGAVVVAVRVHPGAGRSGVVGRHGEELKIRVAAPPVDGRANDAVLDLVADLFGVRRSAVELVSGATARSKRVRVSGISVEGAGEAVDRALGGRTTR